MKKEITDQLRHVMEALESDFYHEMGEIRLEGFRTSEELSPEAAELCARERWPEGTAWGQPREYAWMFARFSLPPSVCGERVVMDLNPGGEATLFLNGKPFGARRADRMAHPHQYRSDLTLTRQAEGGETYRLAMEVYAGTPLPAHPGRPVFPENGVRYEHEGPAVMGRSTFGLWNEEAYQLWLDLTVLRDVHDYLDQDDAFREALDAGFERMLNDLDMEQPLQERRKAYARAREMMSPFMQAHNGTFAPQIGVIANSHLDLAWLWTMGETRRKTARTFAAQLRLLKEYPEALFIQSQCAEYELCRKYYPDLFEDIKKAIQGGQWIADGGMWVEPDTNMAGGESLVRQFLYGRKYFREVLGVDSRVAWLPDTFGYSAALPQILRGFGMTGLTTQKIYWSYNDSEAFPHHAFLWKGIDGTVIPSFLHMFYETQVDAATVHNRWVHRLERDGSCDFYMPFGYGDGGGGPTRDDMELIRRQQDLQGAPKLYWMGPGDYLRKRNDGNLPVVRGELYLPCHRGTYTTQAAIKQGNRRSEHMLRAWEMLAALAAFSGNTVYPGKELEETWKLLLTNQFHDILPGSSIPEVYEQARKDLLSVQGKAMHGAVEALKIFCSGGEGITVFNPSSHRVTRTVPVDSRFCSGACTADGKVFPAMPGEQAALLLMDLEPLAAVSLYPAQVDAICKVSARKEKDGFILENSRIRVVVSNRGTLVSMVTRADGQERIRSESNVFHLYRDLPRRFDAWDIDSQTEQREIELKAEVSVNITCASGIYAELEMNMRFSSSEIRQRIRLMPDAEQLEFYTEVEWHEMHRLLKVSFDTGIEADNAVHQIQFGTIARPAHRSRQYDADRFEVCAHGWTALLDASRGAAVLNDCKYGVSVLDGVIGLSLLRAPTYPDADADRGLHCFAYAYRVWNGSLEESGVQEAAEALNDPVITVPGTCRPIPGLHCDETAVIVESVKLAEDGSGDLIFRMYESLGGTRKTVFRPDFSYADVWVCSMEEEKLYALETDGQQLALTLRPFEIVTMRFSPRA